MAERIQTYRPAAIGTPLGEDVLLLRSLSVSEELGRPFHIDLQLVSEDSKISFSSILGQNVSIRLIRPDGESRHFNGYVSRFTQAASLGRLWQYRATVVPWLWFLTRTTNCRIFQNMTVPDIIKSVCRDRGFTDLDDRLSSSYRTWEYCVQYRESDFHFLSRLMEQEGIYYYFRHSNAKHVLVLADSPMSHQPFPGYETIPYRPPDHAFRQKEYVHDWNIQQEVQPGAYALNDFDFQAPKKSLRTLCQHPRPHAASDFEVYDYPGDYSEFGDGQNYARVRVEELQAQHEVLIGHTDARGVAAGSTFQLADHPRSDQCRQYLVTSTEIHVHSDEYDSAESGGAGGSSFACSFTAIDSEQAFRPVRATPKPVVQGPQTAIVVGKAGEEIWTDNYGRVKVQFHWDRYGKADESSSCWIRVAQLWAGKQWGAMYIPRMGQEVIVEFLEGDPDRPIITGRVYNGEAMPPYDLPGNATMSTIKSNSSKGSQGFNEVRFEDKKGQEQVFIHAEKNQDIRVKNDTFEWIGNDRHLIVKKDQIEHVENNRHEVVDADHMEKIGKDRHLKVVGKEAKKVGGSHSFQVAGDVIEVFQANHSEQVTGNYFLKAENIVIEGLTNITIKVGGSYIAIAADGIRIATGGTIELESTGTTDVKAGTALTLKGGATAEMGSPLTTVKADGVLTVQGGMVKIN